MLLGFVLAWIMYIKKPDAPAALAKQQHGLYAFLLNKWYFDELYDLIFVRPDQSDWARSFGKRVMARLLTVPLTGWPWGFVPFFTRLAGRAQSGYVFTMHLRYLSDWLPSSHG